MHEQTQPISCSLPPSNQDSTKPSMACQQVGTQAQPTVTGRSSGGADDDDVRTHRGAEDHLVPSAPADDFEFCILSSGGLAPAGGDDAVDMCVADDVFAGGKLLPLRLSSAASADASALLRLLRSDSLDGAATASTTTTSSGFSSRSVSRSSSGCVSRSTSSNSNSASSDHAGPAGSSSSSSSSKSASSAAVPLRLPRRSLSSSMFYAHPSPSPRPPPRRSAAKPAAARRSTGSAPPASWGVIRLGVVGAPEVYAPRPAEYRKAAASRSGSGSRSARFEQHRAADKKLALGLLGAGLVCSCSPDAVAPVGSAEVAAAEARRRRKKKKAEEKKRSSATAEQSGKATARRSRILDWLEDLSISKEKSAEIIVS